MPLRELRKKGCGCLAQKVCEDMSTCPSETAFAKGYRAGFEKALFVVADWGRRMKNPAAHDAIGKAVMLLQKLKESSENAAPNECGGVEC